MDWTDRKEYDRAYRQKHKKHLAQIKAALSQDYRAYHSYQTEIKKNAKANERWAKT